MNKLQQEVFYYLTRLNSTSETDRHNDLQRMLSIGGSFCIYSVCGNGTTTLMYHFSKIIDGTFIDCTLLEGESNLVSQLEEIINPKDTNPLLLDEADILLNLIDEDDGIIYGYNSFLAVLQKLSEKRQVIIRMHPIDYIIDYTSNKKISEEDFKNDLSKIGFSILQIGKISYQELKAICDAQFNRINFPFPEIFIKYAHDTYNNLSQQLKYIGYAFRLMVERPEVQLEVESVERLNKKYHMWWGDGKYTTIPTATKQA